MKTTAITAKQNEKIESRAAMRARITAEMGLPFTASGSRAVLDEVAAQWRRGVRA